MKTRIGFVSNSSSSSFAIYKKHLTGRQVEQIKNHAKIGEELGIGYAKEWEWSIQESDHIIGGSTWMDNFDMHQFLREIGVNPDNQEVVEWSDSPFLTGEELQGITDCMENDLVEVITNKLVDYLTDRMSSGQIWEREDIREIVHREVAL